MMIDTTDTSKDMCFDIKLGMRNHRHEVIMGYEEEQQDITRHVKQASKRDISEKPRQEKIISVDFTKKPSEEGLLVTDSSRVATAHFVDIDPDDGGDYTTTAYHSKKHQR